MSTSLQFLDLPRLLPMRMLLIIDQYYILNFDDAHVESKADDRVVSVPAAGA
jgi:hypothetical protein